MITRFAPTPSGFLHLGNAVHARLLTMLAEEQGWSIRLRIDDLDPGRTRPEYVADILHLVEWLDMPIDGDVWRQSDHLDDYVRARDQLIDCGAYVCACSRSDWAEHAGPGCPRACSGLKLISGITALRIAAEGDDIVVWRREGIPAYHLANIVDDDLMGVTRILRGEDLLASTKTQRHLSALLPGNGFTDIEVVHHPLVTSVRGEKLSKSAGAQAQPLERTPETRDEIERGAEQMREALTNLRP
jgi:glutamyl/glutaminyl-tRNA synthetase